MHTEQIICSHTHSRVEHVSRFPILRVSQYLRKKGFCLLKMGHSIQMLNAVYNFAQQGWFCLGESPIPRFRCNPNTVFTGRTPIERLYSWWRHQMETFSALLAICAGNSPVPGEFPAQRPVTRSFDVFFYLHPNKWLSKQWRGWWFETLPCPLRRHRNAENTFIWRPGTVHILCTNMTKICNFYPK